MARSLETAPAARSLMIALPRMRDVRDLLDRGGGDAASVDACYGEKLPALLPRRLGDLVARRWRN
jgi:hypothetical protein